MLDLTYFEQVLRTHRSELQQRLDNIEHELDKPADPDAEERATEREGDEVLEGVGRVGLDEIRAINAALKRIEDGTYGICASCGEGSSMKRLATAALIAGGMLAASVSTAGAATYECRFCWCIVLF